MADDARVLVLYTGGTIGMLKENGSLHPKKGYLTNYLKKNTRFNDASATSLFSHSDSSTVYDNWIKSGSNTPSSKNQPSQEDSFIKVITSAGPTLLPALVTPQTSNKRITYCILEFEELIDSSEVEIKDWLLIAKTIEDNYSSFDSFIILHGTDTLAYTSSALSFLLENLGKTVIITGSQLPLSELRNDSVDNFLSSLIIAGTFLIPEVSVVFNQSLRRGNRVLKYSSTEFDAFASPNLSALAQVGTSIEVQWSLVLRPSSEPFRAHKSMSDKVVVLRIFPSISVATIKAFLASEAIKGVVLETYGAGNAPKKPAFINALKEAADRGVVIVNVTQCDRGIVSAIYDTGLTTANSGVVGGADMTTEAALAKLSYLLSKNLSPAQIRDLIAIPLRGELTPVKVISYQSPISPSDRIQQILQNVIRSNSPSPGLSIDGRTTTEADGLGLQSWPRTEQDAIEIEIALRPYLLGKLASSQDQQLVDYFASSPNSLDGLSESCNPSQQTMLHIAVITGSSNYSLLLQKGASVHQRDKFCHTVLFYGASDLGTKKEFEFQKKMCKDLRAVGALLGETEITRGDVGLEIFRSTKEGRGREELWRIACGNQENFDRAKRIALELMQ